MPAEGRENPLLKKGNSDAFFREKYLTKNIYILIDMYGKLIKKKNGHLYQIMLDYMSCISTGEYIWIRMLKL